MDIAFEGAVPGDDWSKLVDEVVDACITYAVDARLRMGLSPDKRISLRVPPDHAKRDLFYAAAPRLALNEVCLDWSAFATWQIPKSWVGGHFNVTRWVCAGRHPLGPVLVRRVDATRLMTSADARGLAARLLAAADHADQLTNQQPQITPAPEKEVPPPWTPNEA